MQSESKVSPSQPVQRSFESQRLRLNYWDWGNERAKPLVLLHGNRDHSRSWDWVARALSPSWHVVAPDLRGHGDSQWSPEGHYSLSSYLYDLVDFMDHLSDERITIVSHSLGAAIALRYAAVWPERVRALVAIEGNNFIVPSKAVEHRTPLDTYMRGAVETWRKVSRQTHRSYAVLEEAAERMGRDHPLLSQDIIDHLTLHGTRKNADGSYSWKFDPCVHHHGATDFDMAELERLWRDLKFPILLPWGRRSGVQDPDLNGFTALFKDARAVAFEAGHWPHHECQQDFIQAVLAFLQV